MPGDQMVQHELVQDDDAGSLPQRVDDPTVRVGVVADVVEGDIGARRALPRLRDDTTSTRSRSAGRSSVE